MNFGGFDMRAIILALATTVAVIAATPAQAVTFVNSIQVSGSAIDRSGLTGGPNFNRLGGFGSDLVFDQKSNLYFGLTDRGPGGGLIDYAPRIQSFRLGIDRNTGALTGFTLSATTVLKTTTGGNFTGLNPLLANGNVSVLGNSLDPEGLVRLSNGNYLVSDEYGPSVIEFSASGREIRRFATPVNLLPRLANGNLDFVNGRGTIVTGRQDNRGFEGLTLSIDGKTAYAVLQDPLVNEGRGDQGRRSRNVRIVAYDVATGRSTGQFIYQLESIATVNANTGTDVFVENDQGRSIGVSSLYTLNDGRIVVIERDNRGLGVDDPTGARPVGLKSSFVIDLNGATNVASISLAGTSNLPAGVVPVKKTPFLDIRGTLRAAGLNVPEKFEGLAFGPRLADGGVVLIVITDNDYSVTQTGAGEQFDVCTSGPGGITSQVGLGGICAAGQSLIPTNIYSFSLTAAEARDLGFAAIPEPSTWAQMIIGFAFGGAAIRRRKSRKATAAVA
jgi:Esterase-like activity of phytase